MIYDEAMTYDGREMLTMVTCGKLRNDTGSFILILHGAEGFMKDVGARGRFDLFLGSV